MLALPLGLVGREMGLGCVLGTCLSGWIRQAFPDSVEVRLKCG